MVTDLRRFEELALAQWQAMPERFSARIENVALLVEDEPSEAVRAAEGLGSEETLLGLYQGVPASERGSDYGIGGTLPDTITLYRLPILEEAEDLAFDAGVPLSEDFIQLVIRETLWHEVGHYFGMSEDEIRGREDGSTNHFS